MKNASKKAMDYSVLVKAIAGAALSRRAALQLELAVGVVHFAQENSNTDTTGKANLRAVYQGAGYLCADAKERDYKTVSRRVNACAGLFDKLGSRTVHSWINSCAGDTEATLAYVVTELQAYALETMDDVLYFVGKDSSKSRAKPASKSGPVAITVPEAEAEAGAEAGAAVIVSHEEKLALILNEIGENTMVKVLLEKWDDEILNLMMEKLMDGMAQRAAATLKAA